MDQTIRSVAKSMALRIDQQIRVCMKPKPWFLSERMWLRIAARFIYVEHTQPSLRIIE